MRITLFPLLVLAGSATAQGPYSILLETGDTIVTKEYFTKIDSLGYKGGIVAKENVMLFWTKRERWTFTHPGGRMVKLRETVSDPCSLGRLCAQRYSENSAPFDSLPMPDAWRGDTALLECYRSALLDLEIPTEENGDRVVEEQGFEGNGGVALGEPNQLILRTGDTLFVKKDFYVKDTSLCWIGGPCRPSREVLLLKTIKGQFYFPAGRRLKVRLRAPLLDMSNASQGRLYANILFASSLSWSEVSIPPALKSDPDLLASYRAEVDRLVVDATKRKERNDAINILAGGLQGGLTSGAMGGAMNAGGRAALTKPENRPFWGTPMPE